MPELPTKAAVQEYIDKHKLQEHFEAALQHVVSEMPDDPLGAAARFLEERKGGGAPRWDMSLLFGNFDADGDGKLDIHEFARAFRALGLKKRSGEKLDMDLVRLLTLCWPCVALLRHHFCLRGMRPRPLASAAAPMR